MTDAEYEKRCAEALRLTRNVRSGSRVSREMLEALDRRGACRSCDSTNYVGVPMLKDDVWLKVMPDGHGNLCLACCEERLGRRLGPDDLQDPSWTEEDFEEVFGAPLKFLVPDHVVGKNLLSSATITGMIDKADRKRLGL